MSQIETTTPGKPGKRHSHSLKVDLTPMVDLGFLLITFFILTAAMTKPTITKLNLPMDKGSDTKVPKSMVLNVLLKPDHQIDYFEGERSLSTIYGHTGFSGIRAVIQSKQKSVANLVGDRRKTILIITPSKESTYEDFMRIIDEIQINDIRVYFVQGAI